MKYSTSMEIGYFVLFSYILSTFACTQLHSLIQYWQFCCSLIFNISSLFCCVTSARWRSCLCYNRYRMRIISIITLPNDFSINKTHYCHSLIVIRSSSSSSSSYMQIINGISIGCIFARFIHGMLMCLPLPIECSLKSMNLVTGFYAITQTN